ncbi:MAG: response regulator [bacterium]
MPKKILIADDDQDTIELISTILKKEGYQLFTASDGSSAISVAERELPDLIMLDIKLPGELGFNIFDHFKKNQYLKDTPVLFVSAYDKKEYMDKAKTVGAGLITKPFEPAFLTAKVKEILKEA